MKFLDFLNGQTLNEEALSRFVMTLNNPNYCFAILTGSRTGDTPENDKKNNKELRGLIRSTQFGYRRVLGHYPEQINGKAVGHIDDSCIILADKAKRDLLYKFAIKMGHRFNHDSILFKEPNGDVFLYYMNGNVGRLSEFKPNQFSQMMSTFKNGRSFTFNKLTEKTMYGRYNNHIDAMGWILRLKNLEAGDDSYLTVDPGHFLDQDEDIL